jgi:hypothetical protein
VVLAKLGKRASLVIVEGLDVASGQQPGQKCLAASSTPGLSYHWRWDCRHFTTREEGTVAGSYTAFLPLSGDERAGVVGHAQHRPAGTTSQDQRRLTPPIARHQRHSSRRSAALATRPRAAEAARLV